MAESNFVDYVKIYCRSGKGGRGSSHFRRAKYELLDIASPEVRPPHHGNQR